MVVKVKRVRRSSAPLDVLRLPEYATDGASGLDLRADVTGDVVIPPLGRALVNTGLAFEIPAGYEAQIRSRSGLAVNYGILCLNGPGTVDADFRGEIAVLLVNLGSEPFTVRRGDRIAQLAVTPVERVDVVEVEELSTTPRGSSGFGSSGR